MTSTIKNKFIYTWFTALFVALLILGSGGPLFTRQPVTFAANHIDYIAHAGGSDSFDLERLMAKVAQLMQQSRQTIAPVAVIVAAPPVATVTPTAEPKLPEAHNPITDTGISSFIALAKAPMAKVSWVSLLMHWLDAYTYSNSIRTLVMLDGIARAAEAPKQVPLASVPAQANITLSNTAPAMIAVQLAATQIGKSYVWGAIGPDAYDCSGLVQTVYAQVGIMLPRTADEQFKSGDAVTTLLPGDLVFALDPSDPAYYPGELASHVGIWDGSAIINAASPKVGVIREPFSQWWLTHFVGVRRIPGALVGNPGNGSPAPATVIALKAPSPVPTATLAASATPTATAITTTVTISASASTAVTATKTVTTTTATSSQVVSASTPLPSVVTPTATITPTETPTEVTTKTVPTATAKVTVTVTQTPTPTVAPAAPPVQAAAPQPTVHATPGSRTLNEEPATGNTASGIGSSTGPITATNPITGTTAPVATPTPQAQDSKFQGRVVNDATGTYIVIDSAIEWSEVSLKSSIAGDALTLQSTTKVAGGYEWKFKLVQGADKSPRTFTFWAKGEARYTFKP